MTNYCWLRPALPFLLTALVLSGCKDERPEALMASARDYLAKNDNRAALIQAKNALQQRPDSPEGRFLLARALFETGDAAGAELEARKALELKYSGDEALPLVAKAMLAQGKTARVVAEFSKANLAGSASKADLQTILAAAHAQNGNLDAARISLTKALEIQPDYGPALIAQARLKAVGRDYPGALALVETAIAKDGTNQEAWKVKGDILDAQGRADPAMQAYRKALELRPDVVPSRVALLSTLLRQGRLDDAGRELEALKKTAPKHPQTLYLEALLNFQRGDANTARGLVRQLLQSFPDNPHTLQLAGAVEYQLHSWDQARTYLSKALDMDPELPLARRLLAGSYVQAGQAGQALATLQPILGKIGDDSQMLALAGQVLVLNGDLEKAEQFFSKAATLDPKDASKRTSLALTRMMRGQVDDALGDLAQIAATDKGTIADMALITSLLKRQQFDRALKAIAVLESKQPGDPTAQDLRGRTLAAMGDRNGARQSFEKALAIKATYFPAVVELARLDLSDGRPEDARKRFETVLAADPKHVPALLSLAELQRQAGARPDDISSLLKRAVAAAPNDPAPRLALVDHHLRGKDAVQAVTVAQEAANAFPDRPEVLGSLGMAQFAAKDYNQALATYGKLATLDRSSPQPYLRMAEVQLTAGKRDDALQNLRKALEMKPDFLEAQRRMIQIQIDGGRFPEALATARQVQKQRPNSGIGYVLEGDIRSAGRNWPEAVAAYRAGLKQSPSSELTARLHAALLQQGSAAEADRVASAWLKDHGKDLAFLTYLGDSAIARKDFDGALRHYRVVVDVQPDNALALNNLAWVAGQLKHPQALEYAEKANRLSPNQPAVMDTLAVLLLDRGEGQRALELLQKAVSLAPDIPDIRLNLAKAQIRVGNKAAARKELETLGNLGDKYPGQPEIARLLREV